MPEVSVVSVVSVVSLFSGCGGMDLGFAGGFDFLERRYPETGFKTVWANDMNRAACETYRTNIGPHIVEGDIEDVFRRMPRSADMVTGGFPCQDISVNGRMRGVEGERSGLYRYIVKAVRRTRPLAFVVENVGGLLNRRNSSSLETIMRDFSSLGYRIDCRLYDASAYGVPQTRKRVFIVGSRKTLPAFAPPEPSNKPPVTAREAIDDLADLERDPETSHIWSLAGISAEQGNRRLKADRPGYTVRAECHGNIQFHYSLPRRISMREAARIQSFPDSFRFRSKLRETERQIGNAVPPVLAWHIAQAVKRSFFAKR
jgi:DNA (cytosine-5)-methyltransferase 1